jgi:hypothetical protein
VKKAKRVRQVYGATKRPRGQFAFLEFIARPVPAPR